MTVARLLLVRHATTAETRRAAFPRTSGAAPAADDPVLDRAGREAAAALQGQLPAADRVWTSHAARAMETATAAGLAAAVADGGLAELDFGRWAGRTPAEVATEEAEALGAWYADPASAPHGGETFAAVAERARRVLARAAAAGGTTIAVTHGGFIRAVLLSVLGLPAAAAWRLDAAPASVAELHPVLDAVTGTAAAAGDQAVTTVAEELVGAAAADGGRAEEVGAGADGPGSWRVVRVNWTPALPGAGVAGGAVLPGAGP